MKKGKLTAEGMLRRSTPIQDYRTDYGLYVKREDLSCPPPGPPFSKARGVYHHLKKIDAEVIGVLDTYHSQAGHAVARACQILGKKCINYYPSYVAKPGPHVAQRAAERLGAVLSPLPAGRSAILYHAARRDVESVHGGYMMPNALKLWESVSETAKEVPRKRSTYDRVIVPISSGTLAAGVIRGFWEAQPFLLPEFVLHLGYSRSHDQVMKYVLEKADLPDDLPKTSCPKITLVDENYAYKDVARAGPSPPWPCNEYYDLKAFRWWMRNRKKGRTLFWNIG